MNDFLFNLMVTLDGADLGGASSHPPDLSGEEIQFLDRVKSVVEKSVDDKMSAYFDQYKSQQKKYMEVYTQYHNEDGSRRKSSDEVEPGIRMARLAKLAMLSQNDNEKALRLSQQLYPKDSELKGYLEATEKAMNVTTPTDGGFFVPEVLANEVIPYLYPKLAVMQLGAKRVPMPNGNMSMSRIDTSSSFYWVGESVPITKSGLKAGQVKLSSKKGAGLVPISNDLLRCNTMQADALIRDDMITVISLGLDYAAMFGTGSSYQPKGITNFENVVSGSPTSHARITNVDITRMLALLYKQNVPLSNVGWIFNADMWGEIIALRDGAGQFMFLDEMVKNGTLLGRPFIMSNQIATESGGKKVTKVILGDFSEFLWGEQLGMEVALSREASYTESGVQVSAFERDESVMRVISIVDFNARHGNAFVVSDYDTIP